jgi:phosphoesterase RecJ-like protein
MTLNKKTVSRIIKALLNHNDFVVASHVNPEGDALGSTLGLAAFLREQGKKAKPFCQDPVPHILKFLPSSDTVTSKTADLEVPESIVVLDCSDLQRTGDEFPKFVETFKEKSSGPLINIDHHGTNQDFGHINLVDEDASSTCEMLYEIIRSSGRKISLPVATCLYTGLVHDTGSFQYSNTTKKSLKTGADLVSIGVEPAWVCRNLYENMPAARLKLLALALGTLRFSRNSRRAEMMLTKDMFETTRTGPDAAEGFINYLIAVHGVEVAMLFREQAQHTYKVSFRSRQTVDVGGAAEALGGGGHKQASGATMHGDLESVRKKVHGVLDKFMKRD